MLYILIFVVLGARICVIWHEKRSESRYETVGFPFSATYKVCKHGKQVVKCDSAKIVKYMYISDCRNMDMITFIAYTYV